MRKNDYPVQTVGRMLVRPLGGALLAICSIGSGVGGLAYGGMHFALPLERQLPRLLLVMAVLLALMRRRPTDPDSPVAWRASARALRRGLTTAAGP